MSDKRYNKGLGKASKKNSRDMPEEKIYVKCH